MIIKKENPKQLEEINIIDYNKEIQELNSYLKNTETEEERDGLLYQIDRLEELMIIEDERERRYKLTE